MKKNFKTLLTINQVVYFGDNQDRINIVTLELKWSAEFNFRENGLVEPPVFNLSELEMEFSETVSTFDDETGQQHESGDVEAEEYNVEEYKVEFLFSEIELNGFVINQVDFDTKSKTITIY